MLMRIDLFGMSKQSALPSLQLSTLILLLFESTTSTCNKSLLAMVRTMESKFQSLSESPPVTLQLPSTAPHNSILTALAPESDRQSSITGSEDGLGYGYHSGQLRRLAGGDADRSDQV